MATKEMAFKEWIEKETVKKVAAKLKVQTASVLYWKRGEAVPKVKTMKQIVDLTKGRVTYKSMIENYLNAQSN